MPTPLTPGELSRPRHLVAEFGRRFSGLWKEIERRRDRQRDMIRRWPSYVWIDSQTVADAMLAIESKAEQGEPGTPADFMRAVVYSTWRITQGIYRFDPDLLKALNETPLEGPIPSSILSHLPEWSVYVETPGYAIVGRPAHGFFATLYVEQGKPSLNLWPDYDDSEFTPLLFLPLSEDTIESVLAALYMELSPGGIARFESTGNNFKEWVAKVSAETASLLSIVLYLCAENRDVDGDPPERPRATHTKHGARFFPPQHERVWQIGVRIGAALRAARQRESEKDELSGGTGVSVRPHVRRAHWHTYLYGPLNSQERPRRLRWVHPILVNFTEDNVDEMPSVIHPVQ